MFPLPYCFSHHPYHSLTLLLSFASLGVRYPSLPDVFPLCAWHHLLLQPQASEVTLSGPVKRWTSGHHTHTNTMSRAQFPFCIDPLSAGGQKFAYSLSPFVFLPLSCASSCWSSWSDLVSRSLTFYMAGSCLWVSFVVCRSLIVTLYNCMHVLA